MKNVAEGNCFFDESRKYSSQDKEFEEVMSYESKHFLQMTEKEKKFLFDKLEKIIQSDHMILSHLNESLKRRNIYEKTRKDVLVIQQIVECRLMKNIYGQYTDARITIRSTTTPSKKWIYFGVISLINKRFITIYQKDREEFRNNNNAENKKYDESLDLIKVINEIIEEQKIQK